MVLVEVSVAPKWSDLASCERSTFALRRRSVRPASRSDLAPPRGDAQVVLSRPQGVGRLPGTRRAARTSAEAEAYSAASLSVLYHTVE
eukprot:4621544-Pleurochrysis_carterae.AAC.1